MSRVVYGTLLEPDGTAMTGSVKIDQQGTIVSADGIVQPVQIVKTLDGAGYFSEELETPISGTVEVVFTLPNGEQYSANLETGAAVDLATLITIEGSAVEQSDLLTLMDLSQEWDETIVSATYAMLETDRYIRVPSGTFNITVLANTQRSIPRVIFNAGTGTITALPQGSDNINGLASWPIYPGEAYTFLDTIALRWDAF